MTSLSQAKAMGGVGSILVLLSFVPSVGFLLGLVGLVLVLIAVKQISDAVNDREIFNNVLIAVILQIVGVAILTFAVAGALFGFLFASQQIGPAPSPFDGFGGFGMMPDGAFWAVLGAFVVGLFAMWIILIVAARFLRRGYEGIAAKTGTGMFGTVGRWYFYGALLVIVFVGLIVILIAEILQIVAFFSLPESVPPQQGTQQPYGTQPL
ncbi:MAG: DUF996 domain-containing protein [Aigarchaeota archaeon]|nr:DUF996 domain-containing protein [Candidatus Calditenuis fumarioli]